MPFPDAKYPPPKPTPRSLRKGLVIEKRTGGCMCDPLTVYPSSLFGASEFDDLTEGLRLHATSWATGQEGMCRCGKDVVYDQWLLVTALLPQPD